MAFWDRLKPMDAHTADHGGNSLKRTLSWPHLVALGVGAIVGTGIYTLIGVGAERAGPAVILAFVIAGLVCVFAALAYAELSTTIPASGSAYTYTYSIMGEGLAWIVGWALILEYTVVCAAVAVGWSGYAGGFLKGIGIILPPELLAGPHAGGLINLPAVVISMLVAVLLAFGMRESATLNGFLVAVKILALVAFVAIALPHFNIANFEPFMPHGFGSHEVKLPSGETVQRGVMAAAAIVFFAFYGFDAVSTAAEEAKNPGRDLTIGIVGSMIACILIYMVVAASAIGSMPIAEFVSSGEPLAYIARKLGSPEASALIAGAAVVALPTVILAFMFGQSRIFYVMARDGLLPTAMGKVNAKTGTPVIMTLFTGVIVSIIGGMFRLDEIAELANAGTLVAFIAVGACLIVLRIKRPDLHRPFRAPLYWVVGLGAILGCAYLFLSLPQATIIRFFIWTAIGVAVYLAYGAWNSRLAKAKAEGAEG